jgi:signal transduction histidine kinase
MTACGAALRGMGMGATSMEEVAERTVRYLYDHLVDHSGQRSAVLVRFFVTHLYRELDPSLQRHVEKLLGGQPQDPGLYCQTLLATAGLEPAWNDRWRSVHHRALPLTAETVADNPMFAQVSETFGIVLNQLVYKDGDLLVELEQETYNIFYVHDAIGSEYIPAQEDFVVPYGVRSVLGFFGMLPSGNLFTIIIFSNQLVPKETTEYFRPLALNVKIAALPFDEAAVFARPGPAPQTQLLQARSHTASLEQLVGVQEQVVLEQSEQIERMVAELQQQARQLAETNAELEAKIAENVRLRKQAAEAAVLQERHRLARDLHDSVTQALYSQTLYAEAAARQLEAGAPEPAVEHLRQLRHTAQQALREMRLLIFELRPHALEAEGLAAALKARLESVEARAGVETVVRIDEALLPPDIETGLYWIAHEALNNALKYADAGRVSVSLMEEAQRLMLEIADDGVGFDPVARSNAGGLGLRGMQERAASMGGQLTVESRPGAGTTVRVEVPYE